MEVRLGIGLLTGHHRLDMLHLVIPDRYKYFINLLKLQAELIKMHDWVQHAQAKVLVIFEGRDSAGKGGVIKLTFHTTESFAPGIFSQGLCF